MPPPLSAKMRTNGMASESKTSAHEGARTSEQSETRERKPANAAPDAVKDPNEKTEGKPGERPSGANQSDPGAG